MIIHLRGLRPVVLGAAAAAVLAGCSLWGGASKPQPKDLGPNVPVLGVRQVWQASLGSVSGIELHPQVQGDQLTLASSAGDVLALDARTGATLWRASLNQPLAAGVGSDGRYSAVVSRANQLIVLDGGREAWRQTLPAQVFTAPLVAGGRVFVLAADRSVSAFDAAGGQRLWSQQRPGEPLILRNEGVLMPVGNTLVVGLSGRLVGFNPDNGSIHWEAPLASPRGTNDVERLVEIVAPTSRVGDSVCARAFQASVGCIDTTRGAVAWTRPARGNEGLAGDAQMLFGTESNGTVLAWQRADGTPAWTSERLQYRQLSAPLLLGRSVVVGDHTGLVHLLSREDGAPLNRLTTDGSPIATAPLVAANTLVVVTDKGGVYGFRPD